MHPELGLKAAVDLVVGFELREGAPRYRGAESHSWCMAYLTKPYRTVVLDLILEAGTLPERPQLQGFMSPKNTMMTSPETLWTAAQLTDGEPVKYLGRGSEVLVTDDAPRYPELVDWAIRKCGWDPRQFECWRLRVEYPIVLSTVGLYFEMQDAPADVSSAME